MDIRKFAVVPESDLFLNFEDAERAARMMVADPKVPDTRVVVCAPQLVFEDLGILGQTVEEAEENLPLGEGPKKSS